MSKRREVALSRLVGHKIVPLEEILKLGIAHECDPVPPSDHITEVSVPTYIVND